MSTVLLTGASGFLGAHTTRCLLEAGHTVRGFVRTPEKYAAALRPLGLTPDSPGVEVVTGDMGSREDLAAALPGCDAVIHTAATVGFKRRDHDRVVAQNRDGTRAVLESALDAGCDHIVHVSSTVALARPGGAVLDERAPLGPGFGPYSDSKVASERVARQLQAQGAPVTILHPGAILGPDDPALSANNDSVARILRGLLPVWPRGLMQYVDVRDVAAVLTATLKAEPGGRFLVPGTTVPNLHRPLAKVTGRRLPVLTLPPRLVLAGALPGYLGVPLLPDEADPVRVLACANPVDASATVQRLGVTNRPLEETLADTVRWLVAIGRLPAGKAGHLTAP